MKLTKLRRFYGITNILRSIPIYPEYSRVLAIVYRVFPECPLNEWMEMQFDWYEFNTKTGHLGAGAIDTRTLRLKFEFVRKYETD